MKIHKDDLQREKHLADEISEKEFLDGRIDASAPSGLYSRFQVDENLENAEIEQALRFLIPFADAVRISLWNDLRLVAETDEQVKNWCEKDPAWRTINAGVHQAREVLAKLRGDNAG